MSQKPNLNHCEVITSLEELDTYIHKIGNSPELILEVETTGVNPLTDKLLGLYIYSPLHDRTVFIAFDKSVGDYVFGYDAVATVISPLTKIPTVQFYSPYDLAFIRKYLKLEFNCKWDVKLASKLINEKEPHVELINLCRKYADCSENLLLNNNYCEQVNLLYSAQKKLLYYDPKLANSYRNHLNGVSNLFTDIEMPVLPILGRLQEQGISIDTDSLNASVDDENSAVYFVGNNLRNQITLYKNSDGCKCIAECEHVLSRKIIMATPQLREIFSCVVGGPIPSMDKEALRKFRTPMIKTFVEYHDHIKTLSILNDMKSAVIDGKIHPTYIAHNNAVGNMSTKYPSLNALPSTIHNLIIPSSGNYLCTVGFPLLILYAFAATHSSPYKQQFLDLLHDDKDFYSYIASEVYDISYEKFGETPVKYVKYRNAVKWYIINLLLGNHQASTKNICKLSEEEFQYLQDTINTKYKGFEAYSSYAVRFCKTYGYVTTIAGRRLNEPDIWLDTSDSKNTMEYEAACRRSVSDIVLGSIADLKKYVLVQLDKDEELKALGYNIVTQIYDDIVGECPIENAEQCKNLLKTKVEQYANELFKADIPCDVEVTKQLYGDNIM